jgi:hypothetical protein
MCKRKHRSSQRRKRISCKSSPLSLSLSLSHTTHSGQTFHFSVLILYLTYIYIHVLCGFFSSPFLRSLHLSSTLKLMIYLLAGYPATTTIYVPTGDINLLASERKKESVSDQLSFRVKLNSLLQHHALLFLVDFDFRLNQKKQKEEEERD